LPTSALLANRNSFNMGELLWRVALPLMCLLLMLLAIPLSFANPRGGRSANLLAAVFLFIVYSNTVSILQAAVVQNRMTLTRAWWPVHAAVALLIAGLFLWRVKMNSRYHPLVKWARMKRARPVRETQ
jgi:lipopolysaccharide export system permease protein